jgi:hypothetical protein
MPILRIRHAAALLIAAPAQGATAETIEKSGALDLSDFLNRRLTNVHINEIQRGSTEPLFAIGIRSTPAEARALSMATTPFSGSIPPQASRILRRRL